jgi:hypothetical protein
MKYIVEVILGFVGAAFLVILVLSVMDGAWWIASFAGLVVAALGSGLVSMLRQGHAVAPATAPASPDPGTAWDPLKDGAPRERARVDWSDHGGAGEATPTSDNSSGDSAGSSE